LQKPSFDKRAFVKGVLKGEVRAASRLLTLIERRRPEARDVLKALYPHTGHAKLLGVTGPAGVGKSTLIDRLISGFRKNKQSVGVLAIDPRSPFTGGALLGDRLRMHRHFLDRGVFIRSLATTGSWGGISPSLFDAIHVFDAMGKDIILIETLGVGQDEVLIARLAETVLLVLAPGVGDEIQAMKAGLLEIGEIIAMNKADLIGAESFAEELSSIVAPRPVVQVSAENGTGITGLISALSTAMKANGSNRLKKKAFVREELRVLYQEKVLAMEDRAMFGDKILEAILKRKSDPYSLIDGWPIPRTESLVKRGATKNVS